MEHSHIQEHSLIDRYVRGTLPPEERASFEEHFLDCAECLEELETASSLRDAIRIAGMDTATVATSRTGPARPKGRRVFAWQWAAVLATACFVATLVPAVVLYRQLQDTRSELRGNQIAFSRELQQAKRGFEGAQQAAPAVYVLNQSRGGNDTARTIDISTAPRWIVFSIPMDHSQAPDLGAVLKDHGGNVIWHNEKLETSSSDEIAIVVPSTLFTPGDYSLNLVQPGPTASVTVAHFSLQAK